MWMVASRRLALTSRASVPTWRSTALRWTSRCMSRLILASSRLAAQCIFTLGSLAIVRHCRRTLGRVENVGGINVALSEPGQDADEFPVSFRRCSTRATRFTTRAVATSGSLRREFIPEMPKMPDGTIIPGAPQGVVQYNNVQQIVLTNSGSSNTSRLSRLQCHPNEFNVFISARERIKSSSAAV